MLDFTSALYLGMRHASHELAPWAALSTGRPAALGVPRDAEGAAAALAGLVGCERATLAPSTLHLFWDLLGVLASRPIEILRDAGLYAVGNWGVERAAAMGARVRSIPHYDATALARLLADRRARSLRPIVMVDGYCTDCGRAAPLREYAALARRHAGLVVVDDTQTLGMLGRRPTRRAPLGVGGGGSLPFHGMAGSGTVLLASSLAKGLGVPIAALAGSETNVLAFESASKTRVYTSPPSMAVVRATQRAIEQNRLNGERLRRRLTANVQRFHASLARYGFTTTGGAFPVQPIAGITKGAARALHTLLNERGVKTVFTRGACQPGPRVVFVVTAEHEAAAIDRAASALAGAAADLGIGPPEEAAMLA